MKRILFFVLLFTLVPALLCARNITGASVVKAEYDSHAQTVVVRVVNNSDKDISAFAVLIHIDYEDGTTSSLERIEDFLPGIIATGKNDLPPRAMYDSTSPESKAVEAVRASMAAVVYRDGTAEVQNEQTFKNIVAQRKANILVYEKADEFLTEALDDPNEQHPGHAAADRLLAWVGTLNNKRLTMGDPEAHVGLAVKTLIAQINRAPQNAIGRTSEEEDYLRGLIKTHASHLEQMRVHAQLREAQP